MTSSIPLAILLLTLSACASVERREPAPEPPPQEEPAPEPAPEPVPVGWRVTLPEIGWEVVPPEPPERAFRANTLGWQKHERGDWAGSKPHFQEAVSIASEYDLARYNLACAHSRLNDLDSALEELTHVLVRDLPRFKRAAREDQDLGNLRRSELGKELEHRIEVLEEVWAEAMQKGTPTIVWRDRSATLISEAQGAQGQLVRPGVWLHDLERFVPAMEVIPGALSGLVDVDEQQAIIVTGKATIDLPPTLEDVELLVSPLSPAGESPRRATLAMDNLSTVEVHAVASGLRVRGNTTKSHWRELRASGLVRSESQEPPTRPVLRINPDGSLLTRYHPPGWSHKGRSVFAPGGREMVMQQGHSVATQHSIVLDASGEHGVVVAVRMKCTDDGPVLKHWIDRLDLAAGKAEGLAQTDGGAAAAYGRDGALYLQIGSETIRYATPTATRYETLPEGIMLAPPMQKPTCD
jgi:hypothetical protein